MIKNNQHSGLHGIEIPPKHQSAIKTTENEVNPTVKFMFAIALLKLLFGSKK